MNTLHRSQIYIDKDQMNLLKLEATKEHVTVSKLIRTAITRYLKSKEKNIKWDSDPLVKAVGKINLTIDDASKQHDYYLYGGEKRS